MLSREFPKEMDKWWQLKDMGCCYYVAMWLCCAHRRRQYNFAHFHRPIFAPPHTHYLAYYNAPQTFFLISKTNCLITPNGKDMKWKFQKDPLGNSHCNLMVVVLDCLDVSVTFYWGKTPFYVLPPQRRKTSCKSENPQRGLGSADPERISHKGFILMV